MEVEKPWYGTTAAAATTALRNGFTRPTWSVAFTAAATLLALTYLLLHSPLIIPTSAVPSSYHQSPTSFASPFVEQHPSIPTCTGFYTPSPPRPHTASLADFGAVGDGATLNTQAFRRAVESLKRYEPVGGAQLNVPKGRWLTGSFNITSSNFTLFLEEGAVILGSQDPSDWPVIDPLPTYGRGRERLGGRHSSLIHARGVSNLVITGHNGTVDGQGSSWWAMWRNRTLEHTRGHLLELYNTRNVLVSNVTLRNSPFWTLHPVYSTDVVVKSVTVLAPLDAPNTDGVDPDSCTRVCIEDCYIESGDDLVAVKSGWDRYGYRDPVPAREIHVVRLAGTTPTCSGVGIGSEMSGGVENVTVRGLRVRDSAAAVRIKTDRGRGGYIRNVTVEGVVMWRVKVPIRFSRGADDHPDGNWDPEALPKVEGVVFRDVVGEDVRKAPVLEGVEGAVYTGICFTNVTLRGIRPGATRRWKCEFVNGSSDGSVHPPPCQQMMGRHDNKWCS